MHFSITSRPFPWETEEGRNQLTEFSSATEELYEFYHDVVVDTFTLMGLRGWADAGPWTIRRPGRAGQVWAGA